MGICASRNAVATPFDWVNSENNHSHNSSRTLVLRCANDAESNDSDSASQSGSGQSERAIGSRSNPTTLPPDLSTDLSNNHVKTYVKASFNYSKREYFVYGHLNPRLTPEEQLNLDTEMLNEVSVLFQSQLENEENRHQLSPCFTPRSRKHLAVACNTSNSDSTRAVAANKFPFTLLDSPIPLEDVQQTFTVYA
jgi:hypothetical protein